MDSIDYDELIFLKDKIEVMSKFNQIEVLKILTKNKDVIVNENKYGIHINLSELNASTVNDLLTYVRYVDNQEVLLSCVEQEKEKYKNTYFSKDNKDNLTL